MPTTQPWPETVTALSTMALTLAAMPIRTWFRSMFPLSMVGVLVSADGFMVILSFNSVRVAGRRNRAKKRCSQGRNRGKGPAGLPCSRRE